MPFDNDLATPFFSIVIPCYNRPEELRRTLQSCLAQDYPDFEAIVVDDGSQEDVASVVDGFGDPRLRYLRQANAGACAARNRGIDAARGHWIALLDSDDTFDREKLSICQDFILRETQTRTGAPDLIFHKIAIDRGAARSWVQPERMPRPGEDMADFLFCGHQHIMTSTLVVRTEVARLVRFDETLPMNQDVDFKVRLAAMGFRSQGIDKVLGWYDDAGSVGLVSRGKHLQRLTAWIEEARPWTERQGLLGLPHQYAFAASSPGGAAGNAGGFLAWIDTGRRSAENGSAAHDPGLCPGSLWQADHPVDEPLRSLSAPGPPFLFDPGKGDTGMPDMTPAHDDSQLPQDPRLLRFLRARSEGRNAAFEWRFSLSDLETDEDLELLTEAQAYGLLEDEGGQGVFRITEAGKALAATGRASSLQDREGPGL